MSTCIVKECNGRASDFGARGAVPRNVLGGSFLLSSSLLGMLAQRLVCSSGWAVALLAVAGLALLVFARRNEAFRRRSDAWVLRLPLLGRLARG